MSALSFALHTSTNFGQSETLAPVLGFKTQACAMSLVVWVKFKPRVLNLISGDQPGSSSISIEDRRQED